MASGVELASAYISLSVSTDGIPSEIKKALGVGEDHAKKSGRRASKNFSGAFGAGLESVGIASWASNLNRQAQASGNRAGFLAGKAMSVGLSAGVAGAAAVAGAAIAGIGYSLTKGFQRLNTIDQAEFKLRALGKTSSEINEITKQILDVVKGTPFAMQEAYGAAVSVIGSGIESAEEMQNYLTAIADAAAFGGTSFEEMGLIFGQVMNKGKFQAEEMLQLNERQIPVQAWLQRALGKTGDEIEKLSRDGKLNIGDLITAVETGAGGLAQKMGETVQGGIDNMKTAVAKVGASLLAPLFEGTDKASAASSAIGGVTSSLDELNEWIGNNEDDVIGFFGETAKASVTFAQASLTSFSLVTRGLGWLVNAFGDTAGALGKLASGFHRLIGNDELADMYQADAEAAFGLGDGLLDLADKSWDAVDPLYDAWYSIDNWKTSAQEAARANQVFTDGLGELVDKAEVVSDTVVIKGPTADELNKIDEARYLVEQIPGTQDFVVIANTQEAADALIAFRERESEDPVEVEANADTDPAAASTGRWREDEEGNPVRIPVNPELASAETEMQSFVQKWSDIVIAPSVAPGTDYTNNGTPAVTGPGSLRDMLNSGGLLPGAQSLRDRYQGMGFEGIGGYNPTVDQPWDEHQTGRAIDVPIPNWQSGGGSGSGVVADALRQPGTKHVIWQQKIYYPDGTVEDMEDRGSPTENHMDHVHILTNYDTGGPLPPGLTLANNETGQDEWVLNPEQLQALEEMGIKPEQLGAVDPAQHGQGNGQPPGIPNGRTEGYIPAAAGNTTPVGEGGLSSIFDLGESAIHGLIDTGAQAASMAATAAISAGSFGAGAAAGPAASTGIQMGAEALKRAVSYGYDLAGIWGEALVEQAFPFGAPHWLGTDLNLSFNPQGYPLGDMFKPPGTMGAAGESVQSWAQPGNPAVQGTAQEGAKAGLDAIKATPSYQETPPPPEPPWLQFGGIFDQGGVLQPNSYGVNLSKRPEYVMTQQNLESMARHWQVDSSQRGGESTYNVYAADVNAAIRELKKEERRKARTHSGRPF